MSLSYSITLKKDYDELYEQNEIVKDSITMNETLNNSYNNSHNLVEYSYYKFIILTICTIILIIVFNN
jgi:hypothetical protein